MYLDVFFFVVVKNNKWRPMSEKVALSKLLPMNRKPVHIIKKVVTKNGSAGDCLELGLW